MSAPGSAGPGGGVVLFDGVCNLCNGAVQFIIDHEASSGEPLRFAALQSEAAKELLAQAFGAEHAERLRQGATGSGGPDSMVFIEDGRGYSHSTAVLRMARRLRLPWKLGYAGLLLPRLLRDALYRFIARNRYRWFGKSESCRVPTPELRARFLA